MFKNSQEYRRSVEMRRASLEAEDSFEKARPRRRSVEGPQDVRPLHTNHTHSTLLCPGQIHTAYPN